MNLLPESKINCLTHTLWFLNKLLEIVMNHLIENMNTFVACQKEKCYNIKKLILNRRYRSEK